VADSDMRGKVVVITGATPGIGQAATEKLAERGARIVQIARDRERGDAALKKLQEHGPEATHTIFYADLSRISEMKRVSADIAASEPRIDVLISTPWATNEKPIESPAENADHASAAVVSVGCRKQNAGREFCTKICPSRLVLGPFSIRHSIESTERISGDRAAESGHFSKPDQVIGFACDSLPSEQSHCGILLRAERTTLGADFLIMFDFLA
jgi:hypothetical protein